MAEELVVSEGQAADIEPSEGQVADTGSVVTPSDMDTKRARSTIQFPYNDLDDAVEVATTIYNQAGHQCDLDQLAAWMRHGSVGGGAFRLKIAAARIFGLAETHRDHITLTDLGKEIADTQLERRARVKDFLNVPLYKAIYEQNKGRPLPRDTGIEHQMVSLGVAAKQRDKARQVFQQSAMQAGFFEQGRERLVSPILSSTSETAKPIVEPAEREDAARPQQQSARPITGVQLSEAGQHPFVQGLLQTLPKPGSEWREDGQEEWLATAKHIFKLMYKTTVQT